YRYVFQSGRPQLCNQQVIVAGACNWLGDNAGRAAARNVLATWARESSVQGSRGQHTRELLLPRIEQPEAQTICVGEVLELLVERRRPARLPGLYGRVAH